MTHTPGPWIADLITIVDEDGIKCVQIYGPEGQGHGRVAQVYAECGWPEELGHNVQLIAAAPDMFAELQKLRDEFQALFEIANMTGPIETKASAFEKLVTEIDTVIAKAHE